MKELKRLIDVKSLGTLLFMGNAIFIVDYVMITGVEISSPVFLLFSNILTSMVTFYFTKKDAAKRVTEEVE